MGWWRYVTKAKDQFVSLRNNATCTLAVIGVQRERYGWKGFVDILAAHKDGGSDNAGTSVEQGSMMKTPIVEL